MKKVIYLSLCLLIAWAGCRSQKALVALSDLEGEWNVVELNGQKLLPEETTQRLTFDATHRRVSGNAGCNLITGDFVYDETKGEAIEFQKVISTRKACLNMTTEEAFLNAMDQVKSFTAEETDKHQVKSIAFYSADKRKLFVISKKDRP
jgi:heat shock protein HslJ